MSAGMKVRDDWIDDCGVMRHIGPIDRCVGCNLPQRCPPRNAGAVRPGGENRDNQI